MKRSGLHRTTPLPLSRKRLPARSLRRVAESEERRALVGRVLARDGYACRAPVMLAAAGLDPFGECGGPLDVHEVIRRSAWPAGSLVDANTQTVCRCCHEAIDAYPLVALEAGLSARSTAPRPTKGE